MVKLLIAGDFFVKNFEESFFTRKRIQQIAAPFKELTEQQDISVARVIFFHRKFRGCEMVFDFCKNKDHAAFAY